MKTKPGAYDSSRLIDLLLSILDRLDYCRCWSLQRITHRHEVARLRIATNLVRFVCHKVSVLLPDGSLLGK